LWTAENGWPLDMKFKFREEHVTLKNKDVDKDLGGITTYKILGNVPLCEVL
jgi:hypothetical protein